MSSARRAQSVQHAAQVIGSPGYRARHGLDGGPGDFAPDESEDEFAGDESEDEDEAPGDDCPDTEQARKLIAAQVARALGGAITKAARDQDRIGAQISYLRTELYELAAASRLTLAPVVPRGTLTKSADAGVHEGPAHDRIAEAGASEIDLEWQVWNEGDQWQ